MDPHACPMPHGPSLPHTLPTHTTHTHTTHCRRHHPTHCRRLPPSFHGVLTEQEVEDALPLQMYLACMRLEYRLLYL